jgi:hypothetical protein
VSSRDGATYLALGRVYEMRQGGDDNIVEDGACGGCISGYTLYSNG